MNTEETPTEPYWAKVPHGIVDANLNDTLKLLLWLCYDRKADWTYSVPEVARALNRTPQYVRKFFRAMLDGGAFTKAGVRKERGHLVPIYTFHPEKVRAVIESQLKARPEFDPETDRETDGETDGETPVSHNKNNITRMSNENGTNKIDEEGTSTGKPVEANPLKEMDEYLSTGFYTPSAVLASTAAAGSVLGFNGGSTPSPAGLPCNRPRLGYTKPGINVGSIESPARLQVPWGIDDRFGLTSQAKRAKEAREQEQMERAALETVLQWRRARVPQDVIQKRLDAFRAKYQAGEVKSLADTLGALAEISRGVRT